MRTSEPKTFERMKKDFSKHVSKGEPATRFCFVAWRETWTLKSGSRAAGRGKMMWLEEFVQWKGGVAEGNLSRSEALLEWEALRKSGVRSDFKGPRNAMRLRVKTGDYDSDYDQLECADTIEIEKGKRKNASQCDVQKFMHKAKAGNSVFQNIGMAGEGEDAQSQRVEEFKVASGLTGPGMLHASGALEPIDIMSLKGAGGAAALVDGAKKEEQAKPKNCKEEVDSEADADEDPQAIATCTCMQILPCHKRGRSGCLKVAVTCHAQARRLSLKLCRGEHACITCQFL